MANNSTDLFFTSSSEVSKDGFAYYVLIKNEYEKNGFSWVNVNDPGIGRDRWFKFTSRHCSGGCKLPEDWQQHQIFAHNTKTKTSYIFRGITDKNPVKLDKDLLNKVGLVPLDGTGKQRKEWKYGADGSGGGGTAEKWGLIEFPGGRFDAGTAPEGRIKWWWLLIAGGTYVAFKKRKKNKQRNA